MTGPNSLTLNDGKAGMEGNNKYLCDFVTGSYILTQQKSCPKLAICLQNMLLIILIYSELNDIGKEYFLSHYATFCFRSG